MGRGELPSTRCCRRRHGLLLDTEETCARRLIEKEQLLTNTIDTPTSKYRVDLAWASRLSLTPCDHCSNASAARCEAGFTLGSPLRASCAFCAASDNAWTILLLRAGWTAAKAEVTQGGEGRVKE